MQRVLFLSCKKPLEKLHVDAWGQGTPARCRARELLVIDDDAGDGLVRGLGVRLSPAKQPGAPFGKVRAEEWEFSEPIVRRG